MDNIPPTDSPEVQQWIQEVIATGAVIPDIAPTLPGWFLVVTIFRLMVADWTFVQVDVLPIQRPQVIPATAGGLAVVILGVLVCAYLPFLSVKDG